MLICTFVDRISRTSQWWRHLNDVNKITAVLVDISYTVEGGRAVILLFCRLPSGERVCVKDRSFDPFMRVMGPDLIIPKLHSLSLQEDDITYRVTKVEKVKLNLREKPVEVFNVFVNIPKAVAKLRDHVRNIEGVERVFEDDILFVRRYLIDKRIVPLAGIKAEGEFVENVRMRCKVFEASKVFPAEGRLSPKVLSFDIECYFKPGDRAGDSKKNPVVSIGLFGEGVETCITYKRFPTEDKRIVFVESEAEMIKKFVELVHEYGPDIICGYFSDGFDFPYLVERAQLLKISFDLGVDGSSVKIHSSGITHAEVTGIAHVDVFKYIRYVMARSLKTDVYTLDAVGAEVVGEKKAVVDLDSLHVAWDAGSVELEKFCQYNIQDCRLTHKLFWTYYSSMAEFVGLIGLPITDVIRMSFSQLVEWFIIRKAVSAGEIVLQKPRQGEERVRGGKQVQGAFVFEPIPGFYRNIAVFDYRSLYPSIIASHNISIGSLRCECCKEEGRVPFEGQELWFCTKKRGFLSLIIEEIISTRASLKKRLKTEKDPLLAARVEALKILANSFYGYLGFAPARWYSFECAESITAWARHHIKSTIAAAQEKNFKVIYGDTDSVFLLLDGRTRDDAVNFTNDVNKTLTGFMELEFEGFYPAGLFVSTKSDEHGAKKKYALLADDGSIKIRGFETVRRNFSPIAKKVQRTVIELVLKTADGKKAAEYVKDVVVKLRKNEVSLSEVVIHTQLKKSVKSYESFTPHVAAALRMQQQGQSVGAGSHIHYVVVRGAGKIRDKVRLVNEVKQSEYDAEYYINHQVLPSVDRIFAVLGVTVESLLGKPSQSTLGSWG